MELLRFCDAAGVVQVTVASAPVDRLQRQLRGRVGAAADTYCHYASSLPGTLWLCGRQVADGCEWPDQPPVVFEIGTYNFTLRFSGVEGEPRVVSDNRELAESFQWYESGDGGFLMAALGFLNEPGIFRLRYTYTPLGGTRRHEWLELRVASPKMDTRGDLMHIMAAVNREYEGLVFRYLTKTFQGLALADTSSNDLVWLSIFRGVVDEYVAAVAHIAHSPNQRGEAVERQHLAHDVRRWTPRMQVEYAESRARGDLHRHHFRHTEQRRTVDTVENRFVKYTLTQTGARLAAVMDQLRASYGARMSADEEQWMTHRRAELDDLCALRLWRHVGEFGGLRQESPVLTRRAGYAQVYRLWWILQSGLQFCEGQNQIGARPVWELYELWCFLRVKQMVAQCLGVRLDDPSMVTEDRDTMLSPFADNRVEHTVTFRNPANEDTVELHYQHTYNRHSGEEHTATTEQRPDIVLNIRKPDGFTLTYLFDAKYRLRGDDGSGDGLTDYPPPEAINPMHRYRDAIYYGQDSRTHAAKEVIGGYILFPGRSDPEREAYFARSIREVNIGAFPLLPSGEDGKDGGEALLRHLHAILLDQDRRQQLSGSIPQKGLNYVLVDE